jgi:hypothetical protein
MSAFGRLLPIEAVRRTSGLSCTTLVLRLYQRHAPKAFRASVGDEEGHRIKLFMDWEPESHIFLLANQNKI